MRSHWGHTLFAMTVALLAFATGPVMAQGFWAGQWKIFNRIMDKMEDSGFDADYIANSSYRWGAGLSLEGNGEQMKLSPAVSDTVIQMNVPASWSPGVLIRYKPLSFTIRRIQRGDLSNLNFSYDMLGRKWGMNVRLRTVEGFETQESGRQDVDQFSITASAYYVLFNKKFSYPAAMGQCAVQKRSAGSPLVGLGYTFSRSELSGEGIRAASGLTQVALNMGGISAGYAQNFVPQRSGGSWLFHISGLATWAFAGRNSQTDLDGEVTRYTQNLILNFKTAVSYSRKNLWVSFSSRFHVTESGFGATVSQQQQTSGSFGSFQQGDVYSVGTTETEWWAGLQIAWRW